ncbi:hypothetical protein DBB29_09015 [Pandoraea cepalis]|uniref:Uncharacterized protein n=1 Tax=Pandoraea cepalis TaxID=2508294 RepID=A0AAW7MLQ8_9BURK|nr:hypothetical protein [Pandoraea cepalis]MDN4573715.1 hypothetical protein [Pandoraea cepalis]MDN4578257.1 hypothetical protein [Pandoraea cepalis]
MAELIEQYRDCTIHGELTEFPTKWRSKVKIIPGEGVRVAIVGFGAEETKEVAREKGAMNFVAFLIQDAKAVIDRALDGK